VVRYHVPFFVGRKAYMTRARASRRHLLRLQGKGRKSVRPGHTILDDAGRPVGAVTSFSFVTPEFGFIVLGWVEEGFIPRSGSEVKAARVTYDASSPTSPRPPSAGQEGNLAAPRESGGPQAPERWETPALVPLTVLSRFPTEEERLAWARKYR
jgi:hypothetical protein